MPHRHDTVENYLEQKSSQIDFAALFQNLIQPDHGSDSQLAKAILHITAHPGSFIRARMAWDVGNACGLNQESSQRTAIAIEYFHTASLVFDDLSCMDDAILRRGGRCTHVLFGEATAMLAALAFINRAYSLIWQETAKLPVTQAQTVTRFVESCLGTNGVLSGQSRDLGFGPEDNTPERILEIAEGKTVTLLRLSLCLPAMLAGASQKTTSLLSQLAHARGLGYQIADDFKDVFQGEGESGKTSDRDRALHRPNIVVCEGVPAAARRLRALVNEGDQITSELSGGQSTWLFLNDLRITVGPQLINANGIPLSGDL